MNKAFENILDRLEELKERYERLEYWSGNSCEIKKYIGMQQTIVSVIEIVHEVAEEYKYGWIQCSERLPEAGKRYLVSVILKDKDFEKSAVYDAVYGSDGLWHSYNYDHVSYKVIAWKSLPEPYNENKNE